MNKSTLRWALVAAGLTIGLAACTVTSDTGGDDAGTGGATGGSGGATGGSGGATGGTGGSAGSATGGSAGSATGGTGGAAPNPCDPLTDDNACQTCVKTTCCAQLTACTNDATCISEMSCFSDCTGDPQACGTQCDTEFNTSFSDLMDCMYFNTTANCAADCS